MQLTAEVWRHVRSNGGGSSDSALRPCKTSPKVLETKAVVASIQAKESKGVVLNDILVSCAGCNSILMGSLASVAQSHWGLTMRAVSRGGTPRWG